MDHSDFSSLLKKEAEIVIKEKIWMLRRDSGTLECQFRCPFYSWPED
jgi:hypothetical protein